MILRTHLRAIAATWAIAGTLPLAVHSLPAMIIWLFAFAGYLGILIWGCIDLEHIERTQLPRDCFIDDPPFRFVGLDEKRAAIAKYRAAQSKGEQP
jgi:hypothetical protein